jgi:transposase-like protein
MAQMKNTTKRRFPQPQPWHGLVLLSVFILAFLGQVPDSQAGWLTYPPCPPPVPAVGRVRVRPRSRLSLQERLHGALNYVAHSWSQPVVRTLLLLALWSLSGRQGPIALVVWPWLLWLWYLFAAACPDLCRHPLWRDGQWLLWQGQRLILLGYLGWALYEMKGETISHLASDGLVLGCGCQVCGREEPWVEVVHQEDGGYQATLCGHFVVTIAGDDPFRKRLLMIFLRLLDVPGHRGTRPTRDGRRPFVPQLQLAQWFQLPQPDISRIEGYWVQGAWPELLSKCTPEILTHELVRRVATVCATHPDWNREKVYRYLQDQGVRLSRPQVRQAMEQSGCTHLHRELKRRFHWTPGAFHLREEWLVEELLRLVRFLQECLETGQSLPSEERVALADVQAVAREAGIEPDPPRKMTPWLLRMKQVILGDWQTVEDNTVRCPACNSAEVKPKGRKPRMKKFYDEERNLREVAVYRYHCLNPSCPRKSFTHMPLGLVPYSRHPMDVHLLACQAYAWSYSTYRRVGHALQVSEMTIYRWVSAWGHELLPMAALFGVVRSSGVVGVDEKYVLVPKNDKPEGKMRRWMYVYLAVDVHTYDLLHIAIYPHKTSASAQAFLLALRAKGYHPRVIVTDLRGDYHAVIALVFPQAQHHECLFHAEQEVSRHLRKTLGRNYAQEHPVAEEIRAEIVKIFQVRTKRTARKRYRALMDRRKECLEESPELQWMFEFLETHWPYLLNAVENPLIPMTNNAAEMVIRRFDQHYQNFCGFESITTAQLYLGVFEKLYRFTPFSDDARPEIRGKSPLQLAGYDVSQIPATWLCQGYSLEWPVRAEGDYVPNM